MELLFLWHKSVNGCINVIKADPNRHCLVFKLNLGQKSILFFNLFCRVMRTVPGTVLKSHSMLVLLRIY